MIYTVFSTSDTPAQQWQSELLEFSWKRVGQPGELVRLVASAEPEKVTPLRHGRTFATQPWQAHPLSGDYFPPYNKPASLLEWVYRERPDGTVLLVDPDCVFRDPILREVSEGSPAGQRWVDLPVADGEAVARGEAPFGLGPRFDFLKQFSTRVDRSVCPVMIPTLIHTRDLLRIVARWLELTALVRETVRDERGNPMWESDMFGYVIAAAEHGLVHDLGPYGVCTNWAPHECPDPPMIHYCQPIESAEGELLFSKGTYQAWQEVGDPGRASEAYGRELLALVNECVASKRPAHGPPAVTPELAPECRPKRRPGVAEKAVGGEKVIEAPWSPESYQLNRSAEAIWALCDGKRSLVEISRELQRLFDCSEEDLRGDLEATLRRFSDRKMLELESNG